MKILKAGSAYFALIFSLGFILGTVRVIAVIPRIGELAATLLELPLILTASWFVSGWLIKSMLIAPDTASRLLMGAAAFGLAMIAEPLLGLSFGRSMAQQWSALTRPAGLAGLGGQVLFGLMPWIRLQLRDQPMKG